MKLTGFNLFLISLFLMLSPSSLNAQEEDLSRYYPLKDGYKWEYEIIKGGLAIVEEAEVAGKESVNNIETIRIAYKSEMHGDDYLTQDAEGVKIYKEVDADGSYRIYEDPSIILPFDLEKAKGLKNEASYSAYDQKGSLEYKAVSSEEIWFKGRVEVITLAGTFEDCLRLFRVVKWKRANGSFGEDRIETWLAKDVGRVKMIVTDTESVIEDGKLVSANVEVEEWRLKKAVLGDKVYEPTIEEDLVGERMP